jgi:hypothetical protein
MNGTVSNSLYDLLGMRKMAMSERAGRRAALNAEKVN